MGAVGRANGQANLLRIAGVPHDRTIAKGPNLAIVGAAQDPVVGRLIEGRYRVDAMIANGGMSTVYRATDIRLDRIVALKIMQRSLAEDHGFVERFEREAKSAAD